MPEHIGNMSDDDFDEALLKLPMPNRPNTSPTDTSYRSLPNQPNSRDYVRSGAAAREQREQPPKTKNEPRSPDLTKTHKEAEMSRQRIAKDNNPGYAALIFKLWSFRVMRVAGVAAMAYDTKFSYDVLVVTSQNTGFAIAVAGLILFMNYGIISSLFLRTLDKVFGIDLTDYKPQHNSRGVTGFINTFLNFIADNAGGLILLSLAVIAVGADYATNYGGVSLNGLANMPTPWPREWTVSLFAIFLIFGGGGLLHIAEVNLDAIAEKLPDIKHQHNRRTLKQQMIDAELDDGVPKAQEHGWALGSELAENVKAEVSKALRRS